MNRPWPQALAVGLACAAAAVGAADGLTLEARFDEPRAFGYQVGDLVRRRVVVHVPAGLALDTSSLPRPGARGSALELRSVLREPSAQGEQLVLEYQVFFAPTAVRTFEMPAFTLRYTGTPRDQDLRVDAWPVTVAPLVPVEVSPRTGLGELQPDDAPTHLDTAPARWRLVAWVSGIAAILLYLAALRFGLPWWDRRQRPFAQAWRTLRALPAEPADAVWRAACRQVHAALDATAGAVLFERDVPGLMERHPTFAALGDDVRRFLQLSRREFFAGGARDAADAAWLVGFCRRCRDAEREA
jgi:mxaA protein